MRLQASWNHKRVCRIYHGQELNLWFRPKKLFKRDTSEPLSVPKTPNETGRLTPWQIEWLTVVLSAL